MGAVCLNGTLEAQIAPERPLIGAATDAKSCKPDP
jgi:hypothetical protein